MTYFLDSSRKGMMQSCFARLTESSSSCVTSSWLRMNGPELYAKVKVPIAFLGDRPSGFFIT